MCKLFTKKTLNIKGINTDAVPIFLIYWVSKKGLYDYRNQENLVIIVLKFK